MMLLRTLFFVTLFILVAVGDPQGLQDSASQPAAGSGGLVSSAHPLATEAGLAILRSGGNAFDAAIAVAAALNVVEPAMSGAGGYGTIMLYDAKSNEAWFLNPSGRIPAGVNSDAFRPPTPNYLENRRGAKSVSTPGNVRAWEAMSTAETPSSSHAVSQGFRSTPARCTAATASRSPRERRCVRRISPGR